MPVNRSDSTPRTKDEVKQKAMTEYEMRDYYSEIEKLERMKPQILKQQGMKEYTRRRIEIANKYNLSRKERLTLLGNTDRDSK